jgi:hypothetical protein
VELLLVRERHGAKPLIVQHANAKLKGMQPVLPRDITSPPARLSFSQAKYCHAPAKQEALKNKPFSGYEPNQAQRDGP